MLLLLSLKIWHVHAFLSQGGENQQEGHTSINSPPTFSRGKYFPVENREVIVVRRDGICLSISRAHPATIKILAHIKTQKNLVFSPSTIKLANSMER